MDVFLVHLLSPEELEPNLQGDLKLVDVEDGDVREITISANLMEKYQENLSQFIDQAKSFCNKRSINLCTCSQRSECRSACWGLSQNQRVGSMNFVNALSWPQWLLLLAIPPAVLSLYFLKLRRKPIEVPSTLLWQKSLEDLHVNSIWQRLRNSLLLVLQMLFLGLLIFACLRPGWSGSQRVGEKRIYMLDQSASMSTADSEPSRLEAAKEALKSLIQDSSDDDVGMLIAFSDLADVRQGFTKDKNKLVAAVEAVTPTNRTTNFSEAIRTAAALAMPAAESGSVDEESEADDSSMSANLPARVCLFSDGGFANVDDPNLEKLPVDFYSVGDASTSNIAILSFAVQKKDGTAGQSEAFARLASFGGSQVSFTASLEIDGELIDAATVKMEPNSETGIVFELNSLETGELKLTVDVDDASSVDNVAYAAVRHPGASKCYWFRLVIPPWKRPCKRSVVAKSRT